MKEGTGSAAVIQECFLICLCAIDETKLPAKSIATCFEIDLINEGGRFICVRDVVFGLVVLSYLAVIWSRTCYDKVTGRTLLD